MKKLQISIVGSAGNEEYPTRNNQREKIYKMAEEIGKILARKGIILITGGKSGIMESASRGTKSAGGMTIGIIAGKERLKSNTFTDAEIVTGMDGGGDATVLALSCDGIIAIGGGAGTLQKLSIAYRNKKPVVALDTGYGWSSKLAGSFLDERKNEKFFSAKTPKQAVNLLLKIIKC